MHLTDASLGGAAANPVARVENTNTLVTLDQVREWCGNPFANVVVKPVIDLTEHLQTTSYEIPDRLIEQTNLTNPTCVFPWCTRPARRCDHDHTIPHAEGGGTCSCNLAPLCRTHHRLKTHGRGWNYTKLDDTTFLWRSPHGYTFLRNRHGTQDVSHDRDGPPDP